VSDTLSGSYAGGSVMGSGSTGVGTVGRATSSDVVGEDGQIDSAEDNGEKQLPKVAFHPSALFSVLV
jgi:hypothetical protein